MTSKKEESVSDRLKDWWQTDNAKAVATVIAVLLIPLAVIAWNYAANVDTEQELAFESVEEEADSNEQANSENEDSATTEDATTEEEAVVEEDSEKSTLEKILKGALVAGAVKETVEKVQENNQAEGEPMEETSEEAVGGIDEITSLPDTASSQAYIVQKGDSVYTISQKVCEDNSYYIANMYKNYLRVGSTVKVVCE